MRNYNTIVRRFESPEEYQAYFKPFPRTVWHDMNSDFGGYKWNKALDCLLNGDTTHLEQAERIISQMSDERIFSEGPPIYMPAIVGAFPNVPASIVGYPLNMFAKAQLEMDSLLSPLTIYIETTVSAGLSITELVARGVSCLAFSLAMNNIRPVEVYAVSSNHPTGHHTQALIATKIASAPMDIPRAVYMLTDPSFARRLAFAAACNLTNAPDKRGMGWLWDISPTGDEYISRNRELLEMQPQDIFVTGGHLTDKLMLTNPVRWVKDMIAKHGGQKDE